MGGVLSPFASQANPTGPAGGDLTGTYPNPSVAATAHALPIGSAGGELSGTYPNPVVAPAVKESWIRKLGLVAAPYPVEMNNNATIALTSGFLICALVRPTGTSITNLGLVLETAGATSTGVNQMGLYDGSGNQLGLTGDLTTTWSTAGNNGTYQEAAITGGPITVSTSSSYYLCALSHMTTAPQILAFFAGAGVNYVSIKGNKAVLTISGQASMPASFTPGTAAVGNAGYWLVAS